MSGPWKQRTCSSALKVGWAMTDMATVLQTGKELQGRSREAKGYARTRRDASRIMIRLI